MISFAERMGGIKASDIRQLLAGNHLLRRRPSGTGAVSGCRYQGCI